MKLSPAACLLCLRAAFSVTTKPLTFDFISLFLLFFGQSESGQRDLFPETQLKFLDQNKMTILHQLLDVVLLCPLSAAEGSRSI